MKGKKEKRKFWQWYEQRSWYKKKILIIIVVTFAICSMIFVAPYIFNFYEYDDELYKEIEQAISTYVQPGKGVEEIELIERGYVYESNNINGKVEFSLSKKREREGKYYSARVDVIFSENFEVLEQEREYLDEEDYLGTMALGLIILTSIVGAIVGLALCWLIRKLLDTCYKISIKKSNKDKPKVAEEDYDSDIMEVFSHDTLRNLQTPAYIDEKPCHSEKKKKRKKRRAKRKKSR